MCRMICAVGRFEPKVLHDALRRMAENANPFHDHERRAEGAAFRHEDGWGAAWRDDDGKLRIHRSPRSFLTDPETGRIGAIRTDLLVLHARRASVPGSACPENTHPFTAAWGGRDWAFCHNGTVHTIEDLQADPHLVPAGETDSERLFHHLLVRLGEGDDGGDPGGGISVEGWQSAPDPRMAQLLAATDPIRDYTALLCLLANSEEIIALARRHPARGKPGYHALWEGTGHDLHVVSSEPVDGIGCTAWKKLTDPGAVLLRRPS